MNQRPRGYEPPALTTELRPRELPVAIHVFLAWPSLEGLCPEDEQLVRRNGFTTVPRQYNRSGIKNNYHVK